MAGAQLLLDPLHRAIRDIEVDDAVVVVVEEPDAEAGLRPARLSEAAFARDVPKEPGAVVLVDGVHLHPQMGHEQVLVAVAVEVARDHAHARLRLPQRVDGGARDLRVLDERAVALVHPHLVLDLVVRDVHVEPAVVVEVAGYHAQRRRGSLLEQRLRADVLEGAVAPAVQQGVGSQRVRQRTAVLVRPGGRGALLVQGDAPLRVVADEQIEPAVAVVVEERSGRAPLPVIAAALGGHVGEGTASVVAQQVVGAEVEQVQIEVAVVVVVAGHDTHVVRGRPEACALRDVGESQEPRAVGADLEVVAVEAAGERQRMLGLEHRVLEPISLEQRALAEVDVEIAVAVVVEDRDAPAQHLGEVELAHHAVEMDEVEAGLLRHLAEDRLRIAGGRRRAGRGRCTRSAAREREREQTVAAHAKAAAFPCPSDTSSSAPA